MTQKVNLPNKFPGHWETDEGYKKALEYATHDSSSHCLGHVSTKELANHILTSSNHDFKLIIYQTAVKERIRKLSVVLARMILERTSLLGELNKSLEVEVSFNSPMTKSRSDLLRGDLADFTLANAQYLASRDHPDLYKLKEAAAERLLWLDAQIIVESHRINS